MIGPFINALPVRVRIHPEQTPGDFLRDLQVQQAELRQYEHTSLIQIQGVSEVPRGRPLFESSIAFDNYPDSTSREETDAGLSLTEGRYMDWNSYPLSLDVAPGTELSVRIKYNRDRFTASAVERVAEDLERLSGALIEHAKVPLSDLFAWLDDRDKERRESRGQILEAAMAKQLKGLRRRPGRKEGQGDERREN